jgi:hypothetical protein
MAQTGEESFLSDDLLRQLISVGDVDLLVGIPSHEHNDNVGHVVRAVEESLLRNFRRERIALIHVNESTRNGSEPATLVSSPGFSSGIESLRTFRWITAKTSSAAPPGSTLRTILLAADLLHAKGCAVIDASAESANPAWVEALLAPIYREQFDFVAPLYSRHKFDGLLTRNLLYPICRALYGKPMRELRATEFAFSRRFASFCLAQGNWEHEGLQASPEMWMAVNAISNDFRSCQTYLGARPRAALSTGSSAVDAIRQTVDGLFWCMESTSGYWLKGVEPQPLRTVGPDHQLTTEPIRVNRKRLFQMYASGVAELSQILGTILNPETHQELERLAGLNETTFRMSDALWVRTVYEFAAAYHRSVINRDHLVQAFVPIYRGRVCSYLLQYRTASADAMETDLEELCQEFERQKNSFVERWNTKGQGAS